MWSNRYHGSSCHQSSGVPPSLARAVTRPHPTLTPRNEATHMSQAANAPASGPGPAPKPASASASRSVNRTTLYFFGALGGILFGYDLGVIAGILVLIAK